MPYSAEFHRLWEKIDELKDDASKLKVDVSVHSTKIDDLEPDVEAIKLDIEDLNKYKERVLGYVGAFCVVLEFAHIALDYLLKGK